MITAKVADGRNARVVSALEMPAGVPGAGRVDAPFLAAARRTAKNGPSGTAANFARGALDRLALAVDARAADSRGADCVRCGAGLLGEFEVPVRAVERAWTRSAGDAVQRPMAAYGAVSHRLLGQETAHLGSARARGATVPPSSRRSARATPRRTCRRRARRRSRGCRCRRPSRAGRRNRKSRSGRRNRPRPRPRPPTYLLAVLDGERRCSTARRRGPLARRPRAPAVRRAVVCEPERKGPRSGADC
ncbi:hypothetical protein M885DRAFT_10962 [Pelagophyceae sp. CCMP2097]|nr:hypothetical protein M885DRAFT_10962 [Pelagophyceae sp. CCMP2097]